jgi:hypothetical protein
MSDHCRSGGLMAGQVAVDEDGEHPGSVSMARIPSHGSARNHAGLMPPRHCTGGW